jgi:adenylate cyclase
MSDTRQIDEEFNRTLREVVDDVGLSEAYLRRHLLALGLPVPGLDERTLTDADVEAWRATKLLRDAGFSEDAVLDMVRAGGRGTAQVAAVAVEHAMRRGGAGELLPALGALSEAPLRWHIRERISREAIADAERRTGHLDGTRDVAIAFVALPAVTGRFERLAADLAGPPVQLVKLVEDGAMLVSDDPAALIETVWALVGATAADANLPAARAGAAFGPALNRGGDWYGRPVDLAGSITAAAEPGAVFAEPTLARRSAEIAAWVPVGAKRLRGVDEPVHLHRLRPERTGAGG